MKSASKAFTAERKKPRPLKSDVMRIRIKMKKIFRFILILILIVNLHLKAEETLQQIAKRRFNTPVTYKGGSLQQVNGVPILKLAGTPEQMGEQYGHILKDVLRKIEKHINKEILDLGLRGLVIRRIADTLDKNIPKEYKEEMKAIVKESGVAYKTLLFINCFGDVFNVGCSTFAVWGKRSFDKAPIFGRNLDFYSMGIADKVGILIIYKPEGKKQFAAPCFVGFSGLYSGINKDGFCVANMLAYNDIMKIAPNPMPSSLAFRQILEQCSTIDGAEQILKGQQYIGGNNLMMVEKEGKACVAEIDPEKMILRKPEGEYIYATNHFVLDKMAVYRGRCRRYNILTQLFVYTDKHITIEDSIKLLKKTAISDINIQSMVFRPKTNELYLACNTIPACSGEFINIKLDKIFKGKTEDKNPPKTIIPAKGDIVN